MLSQTDSQCSRWEQLHGYLKQQRNATIPISIAIYIDVLSPLGRLWLSFQQELHGPVKAIGRVQEFMWTMAKLKLLLDKSLDQDETIMTHYKNLMSKIKKKNYKGKIYYYQEIKLRSYQNVNVQNTFSDIISSISNCMSVCFASLEDSVLFENLVKLLDLKRGHQKKIVFNLIIQKL